MSDLVMEMKYMHVMEGRYEEPSLAGLLMGVRVLFCKPMESLLPVVTGSVVLRQGYSDSALFYLLVVPPFVCSCLQLFAWSRFDLSPKRKAKIRSSVLQTRDRLDSEAHPV
jgi:hypothetical protein